MRYSTNPKSGDKLSVLGFGCMRFPRDRSLTEKLIIDAVNGGINYFDTAYVYPGSEATLGAILDSNGLRGKVHIATKLPHRKCKAYADFDRLFSEQLGRLKTDYIDYYLIHNISDASLWGALCALGIEKWIAEKKKSGQIRQIGFSFHGSQNGFLELLDAYDWDFCQIQYNYMDENYQAGRAGLLRAHAKGLPVIVMEPLLGGKLATGLPPKAAKLLQGFDPGRSAASWGLRWLWDQPEVTVVLSGMNGADQLADNMKTAEGSAPGILSEREAEIYASVVGVIRESYKVPCTGCNYCMPCPHGVNIPGCFAAYNTSFALGFIPGITQYLTSTGANHPEKQEFASKCVKCGACEKKCPQHIKVSESLVAVKKKMEPWWFKAALWIVRKIMS